MITGHHCQNPSHAGLTHPLEKILVLVAVVEHEEALSNKIWGVREVEAG